MKWKCNVLMKLRSPLICLIICRGSKVRGGGSEVSDSRFSDVNNVTGHQTWVEGTREKRRRMASLKTAEEAATAAATAVAQGRERVLRVLNSFIKATCSISCCQKFWQHFSPSYRTPKTCTTYSRYICGLGISQGFRQRRAKATATLMRSRKALAIRVDEPVILLVVCESSVRTRLFDTGDRNSWKK